MNLTWNNNIALFKSRFSSLYDIYQKEIQTVKEWIDTSEEHFFTVTPSKNGLLTAAEGNLHLHSAYNPQKEAQNSVLQKQVEEKSTLVFYGCGLGWHVIEACKAYPKKKIILVEWDILRFFYTLAFLDWKEVFNQNQIILALGCPQETFISLIEDSSKINLGDTGVNDTYFFDFPSFTAHNEDYFNILRTLVKRNIQKNQINAATLKKFGKIWCKNSLSNLDNLTCKKNISVLEGKASDLPFVIIGAGPSLEKLLPHLEAIKEKAVLVCVETALHTLLRNNLEPDFIILLDSQYWAYKHIAGLKADSSYLITDIAVHPAVFRFPCKDILLCSSQFIIGQYFQNQLGLNPGELGTGGSVACSAWNFAYFCGAKEIYFAGVDLGFPGKQTHIKGSSAEQTFHKISSRLLPSEKLVSGSLFSANATFDKDYSGNPVITDSRMKMFAWWFESRLASCQNQKTYTLCTESLKIPGVDPYSLETFLSKKDISLKKEEFLYLLEKPFELKTEQLSKFLKIKKDFPSEQFLTENPFLKPYL